MFDIQKFAEETTEEHSTPVESAQENLPPIPEDFDGVSENVAREIMAKSAEQNSTQVESEFDEVDDDGNYTGEKDLSRVKIPYSRFKQTIDKKNELENKAKDFEKKLEIYRQRFGDLDSQPQNFQQQPQDTPAQTPAQPRYFNEEDVKNIDEAIKATTMQMTGFRRKMLTDWIISTQMAQSVNEFQNYTQQQTQAAEYEAVRNFATTEFFYAQSSVAQHVIKDADWRLQNNLATPADYKTITDFFTMAKYAYDAKNAAQLPQTPAPKTAQKKSVPQFPRTDKVNGVPGSGGGVTNAALAEMMHTQSWSNIAPEYRKKLMGY